MNSEVRKVSQEKNRTMKKLIRSMRWETRLVCDVHTWELLEHPSLWQASAIAKHQCNDLLPQRETGAGCGTETSIELFKHGMMYSLCFCAFLNSREFTLVH